MESKKRNKLGTILLCSLPPLSALVVTGVVIGTTSKPVIPEPVVEGWVTEPEKAEDREAVSVTNYVNDAVKYVFGFGGIFKLTDSSLDISNISASAKLTYTPSTNDDPIVFDMSGELVEESQQDKTFKINLFKKFTTQEELETIMSIPAETELSISEFKITNKITGEIYDCQKAYKTTIMPSLLIEPDDDEWIIDIKLSDDGHYAFSTSFMPVNAYNPLPEEEVEQSAFTVVTKDASFVQETETRRPYWKLDSSSNIKFYQGFSTVPATGTTTEIGFELKGDDNIVYFKKEIGVGPAIKIRVPEPQY